MSEHLFAPAYARGSAVPDGVQHFPGDLERIDEEILTADRNEQSRERTQLALQRTLWAAEQTLNTWLRTALTSVMAGLAVLQFLESKYAWVVPTIAITLTTTGIALYVFALWRYAVESRRLKAAGTIVTPFWMLTLLVLPLLGAGVLALIIAFR